VLFHSDKVCLIGFFTGVFFLFTRSLGVCQFLLFPPFSWYISFPRVCRSHHPRYHCTWSGQYWSFFLISVSAKPCLCRPLPRFLAIFFFPHGGHTHASLFFFFFFLHIRFLNAAVSPFPLSFYFKRLPFGSLFSFRSSLPDGLVGPSCLHSFPTTHHPSPSTFLLSQSEIHISSWDPGWLDIFRNVFFFYFFTTPPPQINK